MSEHNNIEPSPEAARASAHRLALQDDLSKLDKSIIAAFNRQHPGSFERNWPEDFSHENGMYENICLHCTKHFLGYKRRMTCKHCATTSAEKKDGEREV